MTNLITDNPKNEFETSYNRVYMKDDEIYITNADDIRDMNILEYIRNEFDYYSDHSDEELKEELDYFDSDLPQLFYGISYMAAMLREKLKVYELLDSANMLVKLPCRVDDEVYSIYGNKIAKFKVIRIYVNSENKLVIKVQKLNKPNTFYHLNEKDFLLNYCITEAEAELRIKENKDS